MFVCNEALQMHKMLNILTPLGAFNITFNSLCSAKSRSQSSPALQRPSRTWGVKNVSTEELWTLIVADFQGTDIPPCWLKMSFSHEPKRARLCVVIECSTFPPIFRALLMPWAPVNDCRWTPIADFHLAVESNLSHISRENPMPNNIIVKLNMVRVGEVWRGFGNKSWSGLVPWRIVSRILQYFSLHLNLEAYGCPSKKSAAYLSNSSLQKQLQIIYCALHFQSIC